MQAYCHYHMSCIKLSGVIHSVPTILQEYIAVKCPGYISWYAGQDSNCCDLFRQARSLNVSIWNWLVPKLYTETATRTRGHNPCSARTGKLHSLLTNILYLILVVKYSLLSGLLDHGLTSVTSKPHSQFTTCQNQRHIEPDVPNSIGQR